LFQIILEFFNPKFGIGMVELLIVLVKKIKLKFNYYLKKDWLIKRSIKSKNKIFQMPIDKKGYF